MNSYPSRGRYTECAWQMTLGEKAVIFANHPSNDNPHSSVDAPTLVELYDANAPPEIKPTRPDAPWYWRYANVPPGDEGDIRPGYWQGNIDGPRSFGYGACAASIYSLQDDASLPFVHLYLPESEFDEVVEADSWLFLRHGHGYASVWSSCAAEPVTQGVWRRTERRLNARRCALLAMIGDVSTHPDFASFIEVAHQCEPSFDTDTLSLNWAPPQADEPVVLDYRDGARLGNARIRTRGPRFATPWGSTQVKDGRLNLCSGAAACDVALRL